ncbi:MAG: hypothetical protein DDT36_00802 [Firmicutes bacterium]|nr:hypothetical protein [Bacillota bacterium]MBT9157819.1 hypothetical protein [Bacillota bacterium]
MSIVLIGGHDRMHELYRSMCRTLGHSLKVYTHMPARLEKCIGCPGGIVIFTSTVSHSMVTVAVKTAKKKKIPFVKSHSSSMDALEMAIMALASGECTQGR